MTRTSRKRSRQGGRRRGDDGTATPAFARGIRQFNAGEFWHSHESWEVIWLPAPQPEKTFLQGLIQIAAGFYHHQRKNLIGARSLLRRGLEKLERFPGSHRRLRLEELRQHVREWLAGLDSGEFRAEKRYPKLHRSGRRAKRKHTPRRPGSRKRTGH